MKAIPEKEEPQRYIISDFIDSEFVEVLSDDIIDVKMFYPMIGMEHAVKRCFMRKEVYEHLLRASKNLPKGYKFRIYDAWRPFLLQQELYDKYSVNIIRQFGLDRCNEEQRQTVIRKYVSIPIEDREVPPVHTTGGAIDLTILDAGGMELDMGSGFDEFTDRTWTSYYEKEKDDRVRDNRRLLYHTMIGAGFTNLPSEWWHFDFGDRFWAYYNGQPAIYKGIFNEEELLIGATGS